MSVRQFLNKIVSPETLSVDDFKQSPIVIPRMQQLRSAFECAPSNSHALEFGVYTGGSLRALALANKQHRFTGFDSFEGLPEAWRRSEHSSYEAGHFALDGLPRMPPNATLVKGFFEDTLDGWLAVNEGPVGFIHIDADLYSAAKFVLTKLTGRTIDGTVIVFDELSDWKGEGVYPLWPEGEWKALAEWLADTGFFLRMLSRGERFEAAVQVFQAAPVARSRGDDVHYASALWNCGATGSAVRLLGEMVKTQTGWLSGSHKLALWQNKLRLTDESLDTINAIARVARQMPDHVNSADLIRLKASCHLQKGELQEACDTIGDFLAVRPSHLGGLTLSATILGRLRRYEDAERAWKAAFDISLDEQYKAKASEQRILSGIRNEFREMKFSGLMIQRLLDKEDFSTVIDIGSGTGEQAAVLRRHGKIVTEIDYGESKYFNYHTDRDQVIVGDFMATEFSGQFDCAIASHVLEHQLNVNAFLKKVNGIVKEGGFVGISVPPLKHQIVGGHVTLWNAGLLLYNLVLAGFDCSRAWIRQYGYNISVVIRKRGIEPEGLVFDNGDIDRIRDFLPAGFGEGFNGDIRELG